MTKTVKADVKGIHPGETVTVTGATGSNGAVSAESIRVGAGAGGGLGALFGGAGAAPGGSSGSSGGSGEPALFGTAAASIAARAGVRPDTQSSTKELHASHQRKQTQRPRTAAKPVAVASWSCCSPASGWRPAADPRAARPRARTRPPRPRRRSGTRVATGRRARAASKRCANACRRTASRCRNARPASDHPAAAAASSAVAQAVRSCPTGVTRAQYEAALKKCGGARLRGRRVAASNSPAFRQALAKFAACMRENGVNVPAPNTSGNGPIFNTKGLNTDERRSSKRPRPSAAPTCRGPRVVPAGGAPATGREPRPAAPRERSPGRADRAAGSRRAPREPRRRGHVARSAIGGL